MRFIKENKSSGQCPLTAAAVSASVVVSSGEWQQSRLQLSQLRLRNPFYALISAAAADAFSAPFSMSNEWWICNGNVRCCFSWSLASSPPLPPPLQLPFWLLLPFNMASSVMALTVTTTTTTTPGSQTTADAAAVWQLSAVQQPAHTWPSQYTFGKLCLQQQQQQKTWCYFCRLLAGGGGSGKVLPRVCRCLALFIHCCCCCQSWSFSLVNRASTLAVVCNSFCQKPTCLSSFFPPFTFPLCLLLLKSAGDGFGSRQWHFDFDCHQTLISSESVWCQLVAKAYLPFFTSHHHHLHWHLFVSQCLQTALFTSFFLNLSSPLTFFCRKPI